MLEGDLSDFSLPEILQLLAFSKKTGRLQLHGPHSAGRMVLADGELMDVTADVARVGVVRRILALGYLGPDPIREALEGRKALPTDRQLLGELVAQDHLDAEIANDLGREHALESLAELIGWSKGSFRFDADPEAGSGMDREQALPVSEMMEQANDRLSGWNELEEKVGSGDQVVTLVAPMPATDVTIPADSWGLLMFIDGQRTIDGLASVTGQGAYDTRAALGSLLDQGLVALGEPASSGESGLTDAIAQIAAIEDGYHPGAAVAAAAAFGKASRDDSTLAPPSASLEAAPAPGADAETPTEDGKLEVTVSESSPGSQNGSAELSSVKGGSDEPDDSDLRTKVRTERLRTDPTIDDDLVSRLIDGVEGL